MQCNIYFKLNREDSLVKLAALDGNLELTKLLVEAGGDVDPEVKSSNDCILRYAAHSKNMDVVKYLLDEGTIIFIKSFVNRYFSLSLCLCILSEWK